MEHILTDIFLYFAKFPARTGLKAMATMGSSPMPEYADVLGSLDRLEETDLFPDIDNYVYAQSFEDLQGRLAKLRGSFLMVDFGECSFQEVHPNRIRSAQRIAVTVAMKPGDRIDMLGRMIVSDRCLSLVSGIYRRMLTDADGGSVSWADRRCLLDAEMVPFVSEELGAYGWTLLAEASTVGMVR